MTPFLQIRGLSKSYGRIQALRDANFEVQSGELMGLVGENGAGKSTLVKVLSGIIKPDSGAIEIDGRPVDLAGSSRTVAVVQQELSLVGPMSVAENIFLGHPDGAWVRSASRQARRARPLLELVGLPDIDPHTEARSLSVAERQLVEIARMVSRDAKVLVLDEPTAALAEGEVARISEIVKGLAEQGRAVVYVTHHLDEIFQLCDRVTVFRDGQSQPPVPVSDLTVDTLIQKMLGRPLARMFPARAADGATSSPSRKPALVMRDLLTPGLEAPVTLTVSAGEILGLAGQMGSGAASLLRAAGGVQPLEAGELLVGARRLSKANTEAAMKLGVAYCSNDRKTDGVFATRSVSENLTAPAIRLVTPRGWRSRRREHDLATDLSERFQISRLRLKSRANTLSGGNQQKVAVGKLVGIQPRVMLIDEPTRGVDVGARAEIYGHLRKLADQGVSIVFTSPDTVELLGLADRIATFYRGRLVGVYDHRDADLSVVTHDITHHVGEPFAREAG